MSTKPILAYDCATVGASVALMHEGRISTRHIGNTQQAAELIPTIDDLLRTAGVGYAELGAIVTTTGPGSFTGVRIGLAALHGLVQVHATPVKLLTTLQAIAWQVARMPDAPSDWIVTLRAGKGEVYAQSFSRSGNTPSPTSEIGLAPERKTDWPHPCYGHAQNDPQQVIEMPDAGVMCGIATELALSAITDALPIYIRPPDAAVPQRYEWLKTV